MSGDKLAGRSVITVLAAIGGIVACVLLFFGLFTVFAGIGRNPSWTTVGVIIAVVGLALFGVALGLVVYLRLRQSRDEKPQEIIQKIDLGGDVELETMKCRNCGAELSKDSVTIEEGAVFISCPYCGAAYQMVEEPKW